MLTVLPQRSVLLLILLTLLAGCGQRARVEAQLDTLDSLVAEHPDSVLHVLHSIPADSLSSDALRSHHSLLLTIAHDKLYHRHTSDSLMLPAVSWYDTHGTPHQQALAHFYLASVYRDMNRQADELLELKKAEYLCSKSDDKLLALIYSNEGYVYFMNDYHSECEKAFISAQRCATHLRDTLLFAEMLCQRSANSLRMNDTIKASYLLDSAACVVPHTGNKMLSARFWRTRASYYNRVNSGKQLLDAARKSLMLTDSAMIHPVQYLFMGAGYGSCFQADSAEYYLLKAISFDPRTSADAYMKLADLYKDAGNIEKSNYYERLYSAELEKLDTTKTDVAIATVHAQIEKWEHQQDNKSYRIFNLCVAGTILIIVAILFVVKRRASREKHKIEQLTNRYISVSEELANTNHAKKELEETIATRDTLVQEELEQSEPYRKIMNIVNEVRKYAETNITMTDDDWEQLQLLLDKRYDKLFLRLRNSYEGLGREEIRICSLLLVGVHSIHLPYIIKRSERTVYRRLNRIKEILQIDGEPSAIRPFLLQFK